MHIATVSHACVIAAVASGMPLVAARVPVERHSKGCRYLPGDAGWPTHSEWAALNSSIHGRLIRGVPLAEGPCYGATYNATACVELQDNWIETSTYYDDPVNVMAPIWLNDSCSPFFGKLADPYTSTVSNTACQYGNIAQYAVDVDGPHTAAAAFRFAKEKNIRVSIKNTGHDYTGRSNGQGSLALWTHNLNTLSFVSYESSYYTGPAAKAGAGVQFTTVYKNASASGYRITGGYCPSVGLVGGFVQGGGHGPLGASYGLAADNTLEFEVVTTDGRHLTASRTENADLYWALSGGGPGNYGLVLSLTIKAHADGPVAGASVYFTNTDDDAYWEAIRRFHTYLLDWNQIQGLAISFGFDNTAFDLDMGTLPNGTVADFNRTLAPYLEEVAALNLSVIYQAAVSDGFYEHYLKFGFPDEVYQTNSTLGGWIIAPSAVRDNLTYIIDAYKNVVTDASAFRTRVSANAGNLSYARHDLAPGSNAVLEAWRGSLYTANVAQGYLPDTSVQRLKEIQATVNEWQDSLKALGGGSYMNEATYDDVDWKNDYFGANYNKLLRIKKKYDPEFVLWQHSSVGADAYWQLEGDGRLCRV